MGYYIVNWSHDTNDWKHVSRDPIRPLRYVKSRVPVRPSNPLLSESIILLQHDTYEATVESQAAVIRNLKAKGYRFATLDECLNIERPYRK
jgi:peptidoglycan/xylan/chitin deacetylase (PgdA/CDA1 family)